MTNQFLPTASLYFLSRQEVEKRTGLSRSTIYELMSKNEFPKPIKIADRRVAWIESEIECWAKSMVKKSRGGDK